MVGISEPFQVRLLRYHYSRTAQFFTHFYDRYEQWVLLMPLEKGFDFLLLEHKMEKLEDENAENEIGVVWEHLNVGEIVLCPPGKYVYRKSEEKLKFFFIEFEWLGHDEQQVDELKFPKAGKMAMRQAGRLVSNLDLMRVAVGSVFESEQGYFIEHLLKDILYLIIQQQSESKAKLIDGSDEQIEEAVIWLQEHAHQAFSFSEIAHHIGLSQSQFTRRFQARTGILPSEYLTRLRMKMVRTLLVESDLTLDEIAERTGYLNGFYLSRVFAKEHGHPPSHYRQMHRF